MLAGFVDSCQMVRRKVPPDAGIEAVFFNAFALPPRLSPTFEPEARFFEVGPLFRPPLRRLPLPPPMTCSRLFPYRAAPAARLLGLLLGLVLLPNRAPASEFFFVKLAGRTHKVLWTEVQRLEAGKNYVTLRVAGHARAYPLRSSLSYVLDQLVPPARHGQFIHVNRR